MKLNINLKQVNINNTNHSSQIERVHLAKPPISTRQVYKPEPSITSSEIAKLHNDIKK